MKKEIKTNSKKTPYSWNLGLLYSSPKDPKIEQDSTAIEEANKAFAAKYTKNTSYLTSNTELKKALIEWEQLRKISDLPKPLLYFFLYKDIESTNEEVEKQLQLLLNRFTQIGNLTLFFPLHISKMDAKRQSEISKDPSLSHFLYYLQTLWQQGKHTLSEAEEKILSLKAQPSYSMWLEAREKMLASLSITWKKKEMPISQAMFELQNQVTKDREKMNKLIGEKLKENSLLAEAELNAVFTNKKIDDELRGFETPTAATFLSYQNDPAVIKNLVETTQKHFHLSHRFFKLKAKLLKQKTLNYGDRGGSIPKKNVLKLDYENACKIVSSAFAKVDKKYADIFDEYVKTGRIDALPRKGKRGGAYCMPSHERPFVLLNHTNGEDGVMTLGHEMGHAIHSELSKVQTPVYFDHSISLAEAASTLFENFVFEEIFAKYEKKDQIIALHDRINDDISTIFRQIAAFLFEETLHKEARVKGYLTAREMAEIHNKSMSSYLGPVVKMQETDGYYFVSWMHIRRFFYVYSYAYGQLVSKLLYRKYKQDKNFLKQIEQIFSAGSSDTPENILKKAGIDLHDPKFFEEGFKVIEDDLNRLESLMKQK